MSEKKLSIEKKTRKIPQIVRKYKNKRFSSWRLYWLGYHALIKVTINSMNENDDLAPIERQGARRRPKRKKTSL